MKAGILLMLGLLAFVLMFAYWLRTPHHLASHWPTAADHALEQFDGLAELVSPHR